MGDVAVMRPNSVVEYTGKQLDLIRRTVASDCDPTEFDLFLEVARRAGLDPFRKQIYAVVYSKNSPDKRKMSIITGIDGYRAIAARNKDYRPDSDAPVFVTDATIKSESNPAGLISVTVKCYKLGPDNQWFPVAGIAYWDEFCPLTEKWEYDATQNKRVPTGIYELSKTSNWFKMPHVMLSKVSEATALRKGWPEDLSGFYVEEEMDRSRVADVTASEAVAAYETDKRLQLTSAVDTICVVWDPGKPMEAVPMGTFADGVLARLPHFTSLADLTGWKETNRVALNHFWAKSKSDALELKKHIEKREAELRVPASKPSKSLPGDWQDYLDKQKDELANAKNATETQAIHDAVTDTLAGARERGEISETDREVIMSAWEEVSEK